MRIFDFLTILNPSLDPAETKLHMAISDDGEDPYERYLKGKFEKWQRWQTKRNFKRKFVLSLIRFQFPDKWLFAGVYHSGEAKCKWSNNKKYHYYELTEDPHCKEMNGRLIATYVKPWRNSYPYAETCSDQILVSEILTDRGFIPVKELEHPDPTTKDGLTILSQQIENTTKINLIKTRVGQIRFRSEVLQLWDNRCSVTRSETSDAIRASHIKPWWDSTDRERLDPYNGLPLVASLDALFDVGLISFASSGSLIVSSKLSESEQQIFGINSSCSLTKPPPQKTKRYLEYHRDCVFKPNED